MNFFEEASRMFKSYAVLLALAVHSLMIFGPGRAGAQITVGSNIDVSSARASTSHSEVVMAADPVNPKSLIACSMVPNGVAAYVSADGGATWTAPVIVTGAPRINDPTCAYGPTGVVYFAHKLKETQGPSDLDRLEVHRSRDGGKTWDAMIRGPQTTDRPWIAVDARPENGLWGRLYVSYNYHVHGEATALNHPGDAGWLNAVALQGSDDGGKTFTTFAMRALMGDSAHPHRQPDMGGTAVLSDGTVVVLYEHAVGGGSNPKTHKTFVVQSFLNVLRSSDRGDSFEPVTTVAEIKTSYNEPHTRGVTATLAADPGSSVFRDRLYAVWGDVGSGRTEIMAASSADKGKTWSAPVTVSDAPKVQRDSAGPDQFMPTLAVNKDGVVGVLWYDRRDNPNNRDYYARFSASLDGGATWLPSVRVSTAANEPGKKGGSVTNGDTSGLAASADGEFHALWVDNRTGTPQAWTAAITVAGRPVAAAR
jgi:hypothetical protein